MIKPDWDRGLTELLEKQKLDITKTESDLQKLRNFKSDYEAVIHRIEDVQKSVSKPGYLPFGRKALVWGRIVHTNELLVHLGGSNDYCAELSSYQATRLLEGRIRKLTKTIDELEKQKALISDRMQYADAFSRTRTISSPTTSDCSVERDEVEIHETYDSDSELNWRQKHRESRQREKLDLNRFPSQSVGGRRKVRFKDPSCEDVANISSDSIDESLINKILFRHSDVASRPVQHLNADISNMTPAEVVDMCVKQGAPLLPFTEHPFGEISERAPVEDPNPSPVAITTTRVSRFRSDRMKIR